MISSLPIYTIRIKNLYKEKPQGEGRITHCILKQRNPKVQPKRAKNI